ncbi:hypothetical protein C0Q44_12055 [Paenibacillus sp. PCH8]|nr:hypothetical protein C0Q44_12055 [Paenibacillus sp. PCH8]
MNFVPEPVSHGVVQASGTRTQIDLNSYFRDRDNDPLVFALEGTSHAAYAHIDGNLLTYSGSIIQPVNLQVSATDPKGWSVHNIIQIQGENLAPLIVSSPMITFDPNTNDFIPGFLDTSYLFQDPNGDALSYALVQEPDALSGLSVSLWGSELYLGGTPTMPTSFTVRATDPQGLYADLTSTLNFVPEPVSHGVVQASGTRTQIDLNSYFRDRDNDPLVFALEGTSHAAYAHIDDNLLTYSGSIIQPVNLQVSATDPKGWSVHNIIQIQGENLAPLIVSSPMITFDPNTNDFIPSYWNTSYFFQDPNGDALSYALVQEPDALSGLSLSLLWGNKLFFGGTPTMPTSFTVRATDPQGLYADLTSTLNFVPEPVSHGVVQASGTRTQIDLNSYFQDRDNDPLVFALEGTSHAAYAHIDDNLLTYSGSIIQPVNLQVSATDPKGWSVHNIIQIQGENLAPLIVSSPMITFDPNTNDFIPSYWNTSYFFQDPNGDALSYALVQEPDALSGLSLSLLWGNKLFFGGTPTMPTSFTVRATDPQGLYADLTSTLNFVPEPVSHGVVQASGTRTQIDLNSYFQDRDNDPLVFALEGTSHAAYAHIDDNLLTYSGSIIQPVNLQVSATDPKGWSVHNIIQIQGENLAPLIVSSPMITFDPNTNDFIPGFLDTSYLFQDPNGDALSYALVQEPDALSGLSVSLWGSELYLGGTPTMPTSFTVRATDPQGLYADLTSTLNFVPEPVSHGVVQASGTLTQIDLNSYFRDRDNDPLVFALEGTSHAAYAHIDGNLLTYSGSIIQPVNLQVSATDPKGWSVHNIIQIQGENLAPLIVSSPMITFDPNTNDFIPGFLDTSYLFQDPNGDALSYALVQEPDALSGLSVSLWGSELYLGGTPTMPTSFTVRATDPQGLYADLTSTLNFVPEPVSHGVVQASGTLTQIDLNSYFRDRDNDPLSFVIDGNNSSGSISAWVDGNILSFSGIVTNPFSLNIRAIDEKRFTVTNVIHIEPNNK